MCIETPHRCDGGDGRGRRGVLPSAMRSGIMTRSTRLVVCACQATIRWEKTSRMNATYTQPAHVLTYVKSVTQV